MSIPTIDELIDGTPPSTEASLAAIADSLERIADALYLQVEDYALTGPGEVPLVEVLDSVGNQLRGLR